MKVGDFVASESKKRKCLNSNFVWQSLKYKDWKHKRFAYYQSAERRKLNNPRNWVAD